MFGRLWFLIIDLVFIALPNILIKELEINTENDEIFKLSDLSLIV
jgi:hypothetical protein